MSKAGAALARRSRTPSAEVERELLAAAEAVLVRDGPGGLTVRAVAAEAGVAPMGLYSRLGGKDGLVDALLIEGFDRLRAAIEAGDEPDLAARLYNCGLRYRNFAVGNRHLHAIMFQDAIPRGRESAKVGEHAIAAFGALVRTVELAAAAGVLAAPDAVETARQIWSAVHGAIASEFRGLVPTPDPEATYRAIIKTIISGLAPGPVALPRRNWRCDEPSGRIRSRSG
jgi:AcrR family transcriptional regulator